MKKLLIILPLALILCFMVGCQDKAAMVELEAFRAQAEVKMVEVQGHKMRVQVAGMEKRLPGQPVVVLETGAGAPLETWSIVFPLIAQFSPVFAYDRVGIGQSEPDGQAPTPKHIAEKLHALLQQMDIGPPYIMVGWSWGGPLIRMFAGIYPEEVAGLVYVDPTDFTATEAENLAVFESIGSGEEGQKALKQLQEQSLKELPPSIKAEIMTALDLEEQSFKEYQNIKPVPEIPVVLLMAAKAEWGSILKGNQLPFDLDKFENAMVQQRLEKLSRITREVPEGTFVMTGNSGHNIPHQEPGLLVWAVTRAVFSDIGRQIRRAIDKEGMTAGVDVYQRLKKFYPAERFNEGLLNTLGYEFLREGMVAEAVAIFELNVKEYPAASNPHDSLAEGYMMQGNTEKAIAHYKKSLELNPQNQNAVNKLKQLGIELKPKEEK